jgi:hypothetical protein
VTACTEKEKQLNTRKWILSGNAAAQKNRKRQSVKCANAIAGSSLEHETSIRMSADRFWSPDGIELQMAIH